MFQGLIPYKHEVSVVDLDDKKNSEAYRAALEENREVIEVRMLHKHSESMKQQITYIF